MKKKKVDTTNFSASAGTVASINQESPSPVEEACSSSSSPVVSSMSYPAIATSGMSSAVSTAPAIASSSMSSAVLNSESNANESHLQEVSSRHKKPRPWLDPDPDVNPIRCQVFQVVKQKADSKSNNRRKPK